MSGPGGAILLIFLVALLAFQALMQLPRGVLFFDLHEGDTLHLVEIVARMAAGEVPHRDFTTPLGVLAFLPARAFAWAGLGTAILAGQILVAAALVPAIWWAAVSRMPGGLGYLFGLIVIVAVTAIGYGDSGAGLSVSMFYNRWAWGIAFVVVAVAVLPPVAARSGVADGAVIGLGLAFLALMKITFFVALAVPVAVALLLRENWRALLTALAAGAGVAVAAGLAWGADFLLNYLDDLRFVAGSGVRPQPTNSGLAVLTGADFILPNLLLLMSAVLLRQSERGIEGLVMLLLAPAFVYITYQNWGNVPQWLLLLGVLMLALRPRRDLRNAAGWNMDRAVAIAGGAALLLAGPGFVAMALSPVRHMTAEAAEYVSIAPGRAHGDVMANRTRAYGFEARVPQEVDPALLPAGAAPADATPERAELFGQPLEHCKSEQGYVGLMQAIARDLDRNGLAAGAPVFVADFASNLWLFGSSVPVPGGSPWFYGGTPALWAAEYFLVPLCPAAPRARRLVLAELPAQEGLALSEVRRTGLYVLMRRVSE